MTRHTRAARCRRSQPFLSQLLERRLLLAADLTGALCDVPIAQWGQTIQVPSQIRNTGSSNVFLPFYVNYYLSNDTLFGDADDILLTNAYDNQFDFIPANGVGPLFFGSLNLPAAAPAGFPANGTAYIGMKTDAIDEVPETNEGNNFAQVGKGLDWDELHVATGGAQLAGQVFRDNNSNGALDAGEQPINGVTVWLDSNNNGFLDAGENAQATSGNGDYVFPALPLGSYIIRQQAAANYLRTNIGWSASVVGDDANFTIVDGGFDAVNGAYKIISANAAATDHLNNRALHNAKVVGDFTLEVDAIALPTQPVAFNDFAVICGYQDPSNYLFFSSNQTNDQLTSGIFKVENGVSTQLADITSTISPNVSYHLKLERSGNQVRAYRDGVLLATANTFSFPIGHIGLGTKSNEAIFDNLTVKLLAPTLLINEAFGPRGIAEINHGNFPLLFNGTSGNDTYVIDGPPSLGGPFTIVETLAGGTPSTYSTTTAFLGTSPLTINTGDGNDLVQFIETLLMPQFVVIGGAGADDLHISSSSRVHAYANQMVDQFNGLFCTYAGFESLSYNPNGGNVLEDLNGMNLTLVREARISAPQHLNRLATLFNTNEIDGVTVTCTELVLNGTLAVEVLTGGSGVRGHLIVNYAGGSNLGTWNGSAYTGITGMAAQGKIMTATVFGTFVGVAQASDVLGLSASQTATWNGQIVNASSVLIGEQTGDADVNGRVDADDYFRIDRGYSRQSTGYSNGDFNYDGQIDGDDYAIIDALYSAQQSTTAAAFVVANAELEMPRLLSAQPIESAYRRLADEESL